MLCNNVNAQEEVSYGVRGNAVPDISSARHEPGDQAEPNDDGQKFAARMSQHRDGSAQDHRRAGYGAKGDLPPSVLLNEAHQEATKKKFLHHGYDEG